MDAKTEKERKKSEYSGKDDIVRDKRTFWRQLLFNAVFTAENIMIITIVQIRIPGLIPPQLLVSIMVGHLMGILFNVFYYKFFHIWKDTFDVRSQVSFSSTKDDARMISKDLKSQISFLPSNS